MIKEVMEGDLTGVIGLILSKAWVFVSLWFFYWKRRQDAIRIASDLRIKTLEDNLMRSNTKRVKLETEVSGLKELFSSKIQHSHDQMDLVLTMMTNLQSGLSSLKK